MTFDERMFPRLRAGEDLVNYKPVFSSDSKYIFVPSGRRVKVFSCSSGECVRTYRGHNAEVVSVARNPANLVQVLSCSIDGVVLKWDYLDGSTVKKYELSGCTQKMEDDEFVGFYAPAGVPSWFAILANRGAECGRLLDVGLDGSSCTTIVDAVGTKGSCTVSFGSSHDLFATIYMSTLCFGTYSSHAELCRYHTLGHRKGAVFTCVTTHVDELILATGDSNGCITLWQDLKTKGHPTRALYHWHTLPVADLVFSATGGSLWSGGGECVLVEWHLRGSGEGSKQFIPRMGLPICQLTSSPNSTYVLSSHKDNCLQLVNVSHHYVVRVMQGMTRHEHGGKEPNVGLLYDPHTGALVLNGRPGHLQFHLPLQDKQLHNLDIVGQNYMSDERAGALVNTDVCRAALSGDWMATVEHWQDAFAGPEIRLKFWKFDRAVNNFILNTNVYLPHYKRVNDLQFRTTQEMAPLAVTTGQDGKFRSWALFQEDSPEGDEKLQKSQSWNCMQSGSYRGLPCGRIAFSQDGSLLALTFCHLLTVWALGEEQDETPPAKLCATLSDPSFTGDITALEFGRDSAAHMVVTCTSSRLTIWNVITLSLHWSRDWMSSCLASDPLSQRMAAFSTDGSVLVFDPKSIIDKPLCEGQVTEGKGGAARTAIFVPSGSQKIQSRLYFLNSLQELYSLEPQEADEDVPTEPSTINLESGVLSSTPFGALVAEHTKSAVMEDETSLHNRLGVLGFKEVHQLLDMSSHTLPWLSIMCQNFMASFLNGTSESVEKAGDESEESISDMDVDQVSAPELQRSHIMKNSTSTTINSTVFAKLEDFAWLSKSKRETQT